MMGIGVGYPKMIWFQISELLEFTQKYDDTWIMFCFSDNFVFV